MYYHAVKPGGRLKTEPTTHSNLQLGHGLHTNTRRGAEKRSKKKAEEQALGWGLITAVLAERDKWDAGAKSSSLEQGGSRKLRFCEEGKNKKPVVSKTQRRLKNSPEKPVTRRTHYCGFRESLSQTGQDEEEQRSCAK